MPIVGPFLMIVMIFHGSCFAAHTGRKFPVPYFSDEAALNREFQADKRDVCEDKIEFCPVYKANGYCNSSHQYYNYVYPNCHASCEHCQAPPTPPPAVDKVACLAAHNNKREIHGSPPLAWDDELEKKAQEWANHLLKIDKLMHATEELQGLKQGENLYYAKAVRHKTCEDAMKGWYDDEEGLYNYDNPGFTFKTGHFTQVVWKSTTKVGVALVAKRGSDGYMVTYIVARYFPAGNILGQYGENVQRKS
ncbi:Golgi-associated plant pathogenesis-related protein 1-like [Montipora capricornis]|uniref:Golgi-associated plant pathogenesis-related protein 1-like n=1 Tax=Montipora capricornis TaxID=246305 RepID=UPI0035F1807F